MLFLQDTSEKQYWKLKKAPKGAFFKLTICDRITMLL